MRVNVGHIKLSHLVIIDNMQFRGSGLTLMFSN